MPKAVKLDTDVITIGRAPDNDVALPMDTEASRLHAEIRREGPDLVLHDRHSQNGTFVNDERVQRHVLRSGDAIRVGQSTLRLSAGVLWVPDQASVRLGQAPPASRFPTVFAGLAALWLIGSAAVVVRANATSPSYSRYAAGVPGGLSSSPPIWLTPALGLTATATPSPTPAGVTASAVPTVAATPSPSATTPPRPATAAPLQPVLLEQPVTTIGRAPDNDVALPRDSAVADHHLEIKRSGDARVVRDLGNTGRVYVNHRPIAEHTLRDGDQIRIGGSDMTWRNGLLWVPADAVVKAEILGSGTGRHLGLPTVTAIAGPLDSGSIRHLALADYFAWYDGAGWDNCNISGGDKPLQRYDSDDPEAIARHVQMAVDVGLDGFTLQWIGPGSRTDRNFATLLEKSAGKPFQSTVVVEQHFWAPVSQEGVVDALRYLLDTYGNHPNFLRDAGRPVLFFIDMQRVPKSGEQTPVQAWEAIRRQVDPDRNQLWIAEGLDPAYLQVFDGLYVYKITHGRSPNDYTKAGRWSGQVRKWAQRAGRPKLWIATVMPGWDDLSSGCQSDVRVPSPRHERARDDGAFYRATFDSAMRTRPQWIYVNSFNEWVEGHYIEPSERYGDTYLQLTRELVSQFKSGGFQQ